MVGIVILNYNNARLTIDCIESVTRFNTHPSKLVVVDNASTDNSALILTAYLRKKYADNFSDVKTAKKLHLATLIVADNNQGYANGNNLALEIIKNDPEIDHILILNSDVIFTSDIIPTLIQKYASLPDAGIISPLLYKKDLVSIDYNCARNAPDNFSVILPFLLMYRDINKIISTKRDANKILLNHPELLKESEIEIELPSGSCMFISKELFQRIGWFDPNTFLYYEENILYKKIQREGKKNYLIPDLSCIHLGAQSTSKKPVPFLKVKEAESARYYINNYCKLTFNECLISRIAFFLFFSRMRLAALYKKTIKKSFDEYCPNSFRI